MEISANLVKELREKTGAGMMDCKKALKETSGEFEQAVYYLRQKGLASVNKKLTRQAKEGIIEAYTHTGSKLAVLVEVNCETDFVARNEIFTTLAKDLAMHIAASNPEYLDEEAIDSKTKEKVLAEFKEKANGEGKPKEMVEKIAQGKLNKFYKESTLLNQEYFIDNKLTVRQYLQSVEKDLTITSLKRYSLS